MWLKWTIFCLGKRRTGTGFSLRGRRKKEKARGREKSAKKRENPLYPIPLFFPFLPIPYPFRRLLRAQANRIPLCNSVRGTWQWGRRMPGGGGCGLLLGIFGGAQTKKVFFYTRFQTFYKDRNYVIITYIRKPTRRLLKIHFQFAYCSSYVINLELKRHYVDALL